MRLFLAISLVISSLVGINGYSCSHNAETSCGTSVHFYFKITNDLNESCQLFWIDFKGNLVFYNNLKSKRSVTVDSWENHYWILTSASGKIRTFTTLVYPFIKSGVSINISKIPFYQIF